MSNVIDDSGIILEALPPGTHRVHMAGATALEGQPLRDLVEFSEEELLKVKNVGEKAVAEIAELLEREGLRFGMAFEEVEGELRVARSGGAAADAASSTNGESA